MDIHLIRARFHSEMQVIRFCLAGPKVGGYVMKRSPGDNLAYLTW